MDTGVAALQSAINRYAAIGGFSRVTVDGLWGAKTRQGVFSSLAWIGQGKCYKSACVPNEDASTAGRLMVEWDESMNAARGLAEFLGRVADDLDIPLVAAPVPGSGGAIPLPTGPLVPVPAIQASLVERFKTLPLWQQIAAGVLAGLGLIFVVNRVRASKAQQKRARRAA